MSALRTKDGRDLEDLTCELAGIVALLKDLGEPRSTIRREGISWLARHLARVADGLDELVEVEIAARGVRAD